MFLCFFIWEKSCTELDKFFGGDSSKINDANNFSQSTKQKIISLGHFVLEVCNDENEFLPCTINIRFCPFCYNWENSAMFNMCLFNIFKYDFRNICYISIKVCSEPSSGYSYIFAFHIYRANLFQWLLKYRNTHSIIKMTNVPPTCTKFICKNILAMTNLFVSKFSFQ